MFIFTFDSELGVSEVVESAGARGLQLLIQVGSGGDDDNAVNVGIVAISSDGSISQECFRTEGFPVQDASVFTIYPGIASADTANSRSLSGVIPPKFQVQVSNAMGLAITATVEGTLIE